MGMKTGPVTVKLTSETRSMNLHLLCLDEMRRICFLRAFAFSLLKETLAFNLRLLYLDERAKSCAHRSGLVTGFYTARYIVGMFVTGFPNEARYSFISVCNEL
jgi:hypothetical protein